MKHLKTNKNRVSEAVLTTDGSLAIIDGELYSKVVKKQATPETIQVEPEVKEKRRYKKRKNKGIHYVGKIAPIDSGRSINWRTKEKLGELKNEGMTSKEAADAVGKPLEAVNAIWGDL